MTVTVVVDSTCAPTVEQIGSSQIMVVPISIHLDGNVYLDLVDLEPEAFYRLLPLTREAPTTAAPPVSRYVEAFQKILNQRRSVFCLTVTSALSNTHATALQARREFGDREAGQIVILDSESAGAAAALLAIEAARLAEKGFTAEAIEGSIKALIPNTKLVAMVDTLEYLHKSGRIGKVTATAGSLFQIKPVFCLHRGQARPLGRPRGARQAINLIIDQLLKDTAGAQQLQVAVTHAGAGEAGLALVSEIKTRFPGLQPGIVPFTPAMGAHTGPGVVGIAYSFRKD